MFFSFNVLKRFSGSLGPKRLEI